MAMKPIQVSQLNNYIKRILQTDPLLGNVSVVGEVSNLKYHSSGHVYFTMKDNTSKLNCFLPYDQAVALHFELAEGMEITASGYISVFERGGTYSLNVREIEVEGTGNLAIAFEKLKEKLLKEGLFDDKYKKPIPAHPKKILLITSDTGAAVRDMIKIITERNDQVEIIVIPCLVQGPEAASDIGKALDAANRKFRDGDVILLGRGGGSTEELWAFNEEIVARSIFLSEIPVISAVGHETDVTIADFVADLRAATPSEAARLAVPETVMLRKNILELKQQLKQRIDGYFEIKWLQLHRHDIEALHQRLNDKISYLELQCRHQVAELEAYNPYAIMDRGYAAVLDKEGRFARGVDTFTTGDSLTVIFKDGKINCSVEEVRRRSNG